MLVDMWWMGFLTGGGYVGGYAVDMRYGCLTGGGNVDVVARRTGPTVEDLLGYCLGFV